MNYLDPVEDAVNAVDSELEAYYDFLDNRERAELGYVSLADFRALLNKWRGLPLVIVKKAGDDEVCF